MTTVAVKRDLSPLRTRIRDTLAQRPVVTLSVVLIALYITAGIRDPTLFTVNGVRSILLLACPLALLAASETICMLTAGIDLSVTMTANLAAYLAATHSGAGPITSVGFALLVGLVVGAINGIGVGVFKVDSLIMTLGMSSVLIGIVTVGIVGHGFLVGSTNIAPIVTTVGSGTLVGPIPMNAIVWAAVAVIIIFILSRTGLGRMIYAVGDNPIACRLAGVKVWKVLLAVYVIAGVLAAIAGLMYSGISGSVGPDQTSSFLLPAIAAAVIGGTSILGGVGGYTGAIFGALILTVLNSMLLTMNTSEAIRQVIYGGIILALAWVYVRLTGHKVT